jgi:hypothetical protein
MRNRPLLVLAPRSGIAYGLVTYAVAKWVGRFPCLWPLPTIHSRSAAHSDVPVEWWFRDAVISDAIHGRPDVILVSIPTPGAPDEDTWFDYEKYFLREPAFRRLMADYRRTGQSVGYSIYRRADQVSSR